MTVNPAMPVPLSGAVVSPDPEGLGVAVRVGVAAVTGGTVCRLIERLADGVEPLVPHEAMVNPATRAATIAATRARSPWDMTVRWHCELAGSSFADPS
jgi:hypothetical protein